jgi:hypothetical protein
MGQQLALIERVANDIAAVLIEERGLSEVGRERLARAQANAEIADVQQRRIVNLFRFGHETEYTRRRARSAGMDDDDAA